MVLVTIDITKTVEQNAAQYYEKAYQAVWNDNRIVAVTPFVFDFQGPPFANFSWKKADGLAAQFSTVQGLNKVLGTPKQVENISLVDGLGEDLVSNTTYFFLLKIKNSGQAIWEENQGYRFITESSGIQTSLIPAVISHIKPNDEIDLPITVKTPTDPGAYTLRISLVRGDTILENSVTRKITVRSPEVKGAQTNGFWDIFLYPRKLLTFLKKVSKV